MPAPPRQFLILLVSAAGFVATLAIASVLDTDQHAPAAVVSPTVIATATPEPPSVQKPRPDHQARRRDGRLPSRYQRARRPTLDAVASLPVDRWGNEDTAARVRQTDQIRGMIDAGTAQEATRAADTVNRINQAAAADIQKMCEPRCLDSPRDAYP